MKITFYFLVLSAILNLCLKSNAQRNPLKQPFSSASIWNMPIGSGAEYIHAQLEPASARGMTVDEDVIIMQPDAPLEEIYANYADWNRNKNRCIEEGPLLFKAPIPADFIVSPDTWDGLTPNSGLAVLMPDRKTIKQTQPFARCTSETATSHFVPDDVNIYGEGITGAHGGSGLSAIGGALRLGELDEPDDTIKHVLKINVYAAENLFYDSKTKGFRWPAIRADGYAASTYGTKRTNPIVKECRMGALMALPANMNIEELQLETIPAKILARAFQSYGAYIVDDTAWDVYAIITEWSPEGRVTEEFEKAWGIPFAEKSTNTPWTRDMAKIFLNLHVVNNNSHETVGGGGEPLAPYAESLAVTPVKTHENPNFRLYPNPVTDQLFFSANSSYPKEIKIYDCIGNVVHSESNTKRFSLNVKMLPKGFYFVSMLTQNGTVNKSKIIKL